MIIMSEMNVIFSLFLFLIDWSRYEMVTVLKLHGRVLAGTAYNERYIAR